MARRDYTFVQPAFKGEAQIEARFAFWIENVLRSPMDAPFNGPHMDYSYLIEIGAAL